LRSLYIPTPMETTLKKPPPSTKERSIERKHKRKPPLFPFIVLLIGFVAVLFASSDFWKRFYDDPGLDNAEVEAAQQEAEEIAKRHENWIQYALIATSTMKRPCLRCPNGVNIVTVKTGEVYKYGITTQREKRYKQRLYQTLEVRLQEEVEGSYTMCKTSEINKILAYRFLPESRKPEVILTRPPGNANRN